MKNDIDIVKDLLKLALEILDRNENKQVNINDLHVNSKDVDDEDSSIWDTIWE